VAETLQTEKGWRRASQGLTLRGVVPDPPGVEEVATGRSSVSCAGTGELPYRLNLAWEDLKMPGCGRQDGGGVGAKCPVVITGPG
jgi:hypothetical protein